MPENIDNSNNDKELQRLKGECHNLELKVSELIEELFDKIEKDYFFKKQKVNEEEKNEGT